MWISVFHIGKIVSDTWFFGVAGSSLNFYFENKKNMFVDTFLSIQLSKKHE